MPLVLVTRSAAPRPVVQRVTLALVGVPASHCVVLHGRCPVWHAGLSQGSGVAFSHPEVHPKIVKHPDLTSASGQCQRPSLKRGLASDRACVLGCARGRH